MTTIAGKRAVFSPVFAATTYLVASVLVLLYQRYYDGHFYPGLF